MKYSRTRSTGKPLDRIDCNTLRDLQGDSRISEEVKDSWALPYLQR